MNLVCRDSALRKSVLERVRGVFPSVLSRGIEGEVNEVLLCSRGETEADGSPLLLASLSQAAKSLQGALSLNSTGKPQIDIAEMLEDLKVA